MQTGGYEFTEIIWQGITMQLIGHENNSTRNHYADSRMSFHGNNCARSHYADLRVYVHENNLAKNHTQTCG